MKKSIMAVTSTLLLASCGQNGVIPLQGTSTSTLSKNLISKYEEPVNFEIISQANVVLRDVTKAETKESTQLHARYLKGLRTSDLSFHPSKNLRYYAMNSAGNEMSFKILFQKSKQAQFKSLTNMEFELEIINLEGEIEGVVVKQIDSDNQTLRFSDKDLGSALFEKVTKGTSQMRLKLSNYVMQFEDNKEMSLTEYTQNLLKESAMVTISYLDKDERYLVSQGTNVSEFLQKVDGSFKYSLDGKIAEGKGLVRNLSVRDMHELTTSNKDKGVWSFIADTTLRDSSILPGKKYQIVYSTLAELKAAYQTAVPVLYSGSAQGIHLDIVSLQKINFKIKTTTTNPVYGYSEWTETYDAMHASREGGIYDGRGVKITKYACPFTGIKTVARPAREVVGDLQVLINGKPVSKDVVAVSVEGDAIRVQGQLPILESSNSVLTIKLGSPTQNLAAANYIHENCKKERASAGSYLAESKLDLDGHVAF